MKTLGTIAIAVLLMHGQGATRLVGSQGTRIVARGDSWASVGARAGVTPATLARRNGRAPGSRLSEGERIAVDNRHIVPEPLGAALVVNIPQRMVFHHVDGVLRAHYPIAVGLPDWPTPLGPFTIIEKEQDPTWDVPVSIQEEMRSAGKKVLTKVPPGPENPLGRHWLRLSFGSVGLHGTNAPLSIYRVATHGCMRVHPDDIADLFAHTSVGDRGQIIYEPVLASVEQDGRVFLEVHPDAYRRVPHMPDLAADVIRRAGGAGLVDPVLVKAVLAAREGLAVDVTAGKRF